MCFLVRRQEMTKNPIAYSKFDNKKFFLVYENQFTRLIIISGFEINFYYNNQV